MNSIPGPGFNLRRGEEKKLEFHFGNRPLYKSAFYPSRSFSCSWERTITDSPEFNRLVIKSWVEDYAKDFAEAYSLAFVESRPVVHAEEYKAICAKGSLIGTRKALPFAIITFLRLRFESVPKDFDSGIQDVEDGDGLFLLIHLANNSSSMDDFRKNWESSRSS